MLQRPPHGFSQPVGQPPAYGLTSSSIHRAIIHWATGSQTHQATHQATLQATHQATAALWKNRLLLTMGLSALLLLVDRNQALAEARAAADSSLPTRRLDQRPEPPATLQTLWVNPQTGSDATADGSQRSPFRSLSRALQAARPRSVIQLAAGTYSANSGEQFPILLKPEVTVQGNPDDLGQAVVIQGGGSYASPSAGRQHVTIAAVNQAVLTGVTVTNPATRGYGLWVEAGSPTVRDNTFTGSNIGLIAVGSSRPVLQGNLFMLNQSGLQVTGAAQPQVRQNIFQRTGTGITVGETAAGQIVGNRISQNRDGIVVQGKARPSLRSNQIEDSERDGLVVMAQAQPDLGSSRDPGQNQFLNSRQHDVNATTTQPISAIGNQMTGQLVGNLLLHGQTGPIASAPPAALIASLPPASLPPAARINTAPGRLPASQAAPQAASQVAYQVTFSAPTSAQPVSIAQPVNISVPPPRRVAALAVGLQPVSSLGAVSFGPLPNQPPRQPSRQPAAAVRPVSTATPAAASTPASPFTPTAPPAAALNSVVVMAKASLPRQTFAALNAPTLSGAPITIPAPVAERAVSHPPQTQSQPQRPRASSSLLPVPAAAIPVGNTGDMTRISLRQASAQYPGSQYPGSQYRVLVADTDSAVQNRVQALVPDAFSTSVQGQSALQIGAFSSYENAQQALQILSQNGLQGIIQPVE